MKKQELSMNKIKFVANAARWFDKVNGNTYHSVNITNVKTGETIYCPMEYGYGDTYRQTALKAMHGVKWINNDVYSADLNKGKNVMLFERENDYPIMWNISDGLKRDCVKNGTK
jgi:hypothetical protein